MPKDSGTRYVCPENRKPISCRTCGEQGVLHVKEEWVKTDNPIPECSVHGLTLIKA